MSNPFFRFKQFTVFHEKCAMKVGTDGVLLGAWVNLSDIHLILDVGTGSGLIALMLAQRSDDKIPITAIDIDNDAIVQTKENIDRSKFTNIKYEHSSFQDFTSVCDERYDLIISNPPYFSSSLHSPDEQRTLARHTDSLTMEIFFSASYDLLSKLGKIAIIYPYDDKDRLIKLADEKKLFVTRMTVIYPLPQSDPKRILFEFSKTESPLMTDTLIIETERHVYTPEFISLAKEFYLKL